MRRQRKLIVLSLLIAFWSTLNTSVALPLASHKSDVSTHLLHPGVTSIWVVADKASKKEDNLIFDKNENRAAQELPASPADLLKPDRFLFYAYNDQGNTIMKQMTLQEIQALVAGGGGGPVAMDIYDPQKSDDELAGGKKVMDIVQKVQNVLKSAMKKPVLLTGSMPEIPEDANAEWSSILPAILTGADPDSVSMSDDHIYQENKPTMEEPRPIYVDDVAKPLATTVGTVSVPSTLHENRNETDFQDKYSEKPMILVPMITTEHRPIASESPLSQEMVTASSDSTSQRPTINTKTTISIDVDHVLDVETSIISSSEFTQTVPHYKPVEVIASEEVTKESAMAREPEEVEKEEETTERQLLTTSLTTTQKVPMIKINTTIIDTNSTPQEVITSQPVPLETTSLLENSTESSEIDEVTTMKVIEDTDTKIVVPLIDRNSVRNVTVLLDSNKTGVSSVVILEPLETTNDTFVQVNAKTSTVAAWQSVKTTVVQPSILANDSENSSFLSSVDGIDLTTESLLTSHKTVRPVTSQDSSVTPLVSSTLGSSLITVDSTIPVKTTGFTVQTTTTEGIGCKQPENSTNCIDHVVKIEEISENLSQIANSVEKEDSTVSSATNDTSGSWQSIFAPLTPARNDSQLVSTMNVGTIMPTKPDYAFTEVPLETLDTSRTKDSSEERHTTIGFLDSSLDTEFVEVSTVREDSFTIKSSNELALDLLVNKTNESVEINATTRPFDTFQVSSIDDSSERDRLTQTAATIQPYPDRLETFTVPLDINDSTASYDANDATKLSSVAIEAITKKFGLTWIKVSRYTTETAQTKESDADSLATAQIGSTTPMNGLSDYPSTDHDDNDDEIISTSPDTTFPTDDDTNSTKFDAMDDATTESTESLLMLEGEKNSIELTTVALITETPLIVLGNSSKDDSTRMADVLEESRTTPVMMSSLEIRNEAIKMETKVDSPLKVNQSSSTAVNVQNSSHGFTIATRESTTVRINESTPTVAQFHASVQEESVTQTSSFQETNKCQSAQTQCLDRDENTKPPLGSTTTPKESTTLRIDSKKPNQNNQNDQNGDMELAVLKTKETINESTISQKDSIDSSNPTTVSTKTKVEPTSTIRPTKEPIELADLSVKFLTVNETTQHSTRIDSTVTTSPVVRLAATENASHQNSTNEKQTDEKRWTLIVQTTTSASNEKPTTISTTNDPPSPPVNSQQQKDTVVRNTTESPSLGITILSAYGLDASVRKTASDVVNFSRLCNELAFDFWLAANKGLSTSRSLSLSPFGMTSLLAMIFLGARGLTSDQMNELLKLDDVVTFNPHLLFQNVTDTVGLARQQGIANAVFVRELFADRAKIRKAMPFYKEQAQQFYEGLVAEVNFATIGDLVRRRTNLLVRKQTGGRIKDFVKANTVPLRSPLAAISANVFQTDCNSSSVSFDGRDGELYFAVSPAVRQRKLIPVPAMVWRSNILAGYEPSLDATAVALGGIEKLVSIVFVLPGQQGHVALGDTLDRLERRLLEGSFRDSAWDRLLKVLLPRNSLELQVPKFTHRSVINATAALKRMGLDKLFSEQADFRGINGVGNQLHLADVLQINLFGTCGDENIANGRHHVEIYPPTPIRGIRKHEESDRNNDEFATNGSDEFIVQDYLKIDNPIESRKTREILADRSINERRRSMQPALQSEKARLKLDRPFLYFVRHNPTGLILHMGRFNPRLLP